MKVSKVLYKFIKPVMLNGVLSESVEYRALTVGDLRRVNKGSSSNQVVRMIALACGVSPEDVDGFKSRDLMTLRRAIVGDIDLGDDDDEESPEVFEPDAEDRIVVELEHPLTGKDGEPVKEVVLEELTTAQTMNAEKRAKGDQFDMVYNRVRYSSGLEPEVLDQMSKEDFKRVQLALSVFFMPGETPESI